MRYFLYLLGYLLPGILMYGYMIRTMTRRVKPRFYPSIVTGVLIWPISLVLFWYHTRRYKTYRRKNFGRFT